MWVRVHEEKSMRTRLEKYFLPSLAVLVPKPSIRRSDLCTSHKLIENFVNAKKERADERREGRRGEEETRKSCALALLGNRTQSTITIGGPNECSKNLF